MSSLKAHTMEEYCHREEGGRGREREGEGGGGRREGGTAREWCKKTQPVKAS